MRKNLLRRVGIKILPFAFAAVVGTASAAGQIPFAPETFRAGAALADSANFPNEEVLLAETVWEQWVYEKEYSLLFSPEYLNYSNLTPEDTPEVCYYFPYFIDFCKEKDLLSYETKGDLSAYELIITDFGKFYDEKSEYERVKVDVSYTDPNSVRIFTVVSKTLKGENNSSIEHRFWKDGGTWKIVEYAMVEGEGAFSAKKPEDPAKASVIETITSITEKPFEDYKTSEYTTAANTAEKVNNNQTDVPKGTSTVSSNAANENSNEDDDKSNILIYVLIGAGAVVLIVVVAAVLLRKKKD